MEEAKKLNICLGFKFLVLGWVIIWWGAVVWRGGLRGNNMGFTGSSGSTIWRGGVGKVCVENLEDGILLEFELGICEVASGILEVVCEGTSRRGGIYVTLFLDCRLKLELEMERSSHER